MEKRAGLELKVGFFVFLALLVLAYLTFQISGSSLMNRRNYKVKVVFGFVSGIEPKAPVRLAGVTVGEVDDINIYYNEEKQNVEVDLTLSLREDIRIPRNSKAYISTLGLMGEKYVELVPGTKASGVFKTGDVIRGNDPVTMEKLTEVLMSVVADKEIKQSVLETLNNFNQTSEHLKQVSLSMEAIIRNIEEGEGTIGKLLTQDKIYKDLEVLVDDIKRNPWKLLSKPKNKK